MEWFLECFCIQHMPRNSLPGGQNKLVFAALTKLLKYEYLIELKMILRCATENNNGDFSRLMLAIASAGTQHTCALARCLEFSVRM